MKVLLLIADGFEEIEAITTIDVLRRADIDVTIAGFTSYVTGAHGIKINADKKIDSLNPKKYVALVLPGGPGCISFSKSTTVMNIIKDFNKDNKIIAAICAAPLLLVKAGILEDKEAVVYPGYERYIPKIRSGDVIVDKNIITSKGPGTAMAFALKLVEILAGKEKMLKLKQELIVK